MRLLLTFLTALAMLVPGLSCADALEDLHKSFMSRYDAANTLRDEQIKKLDASYLSALERMQDKAKSSGNLDSVVPILDEIQAVKTAADPVPELPANATGELKQMRAKHTESRSKILKAHAETVTGLFGKMDQALKSQEVELTKAGKIDAALAAKHMRESLAADQGATAAREFLDAASSKSSSTAWRSLLKEPMEVTKKGLWDPCILSEIGPEKKVLVPFADMLKTQRERPDQILMGHAPAITEFSLSKHATQIRGKIFLGNVAGNARFTIHAGKKVVFDQVMANKAEAQSFEASFDPTKTLTLGIDPLEADNNDWCAWLAPEIR